MTATDKLIRLYGTHDQATIDQLTRCVTAEPHAIGVLCADGHLGYSMPIGGVVAYKDHVSPSGVGYDIACGNMAVRTGIPAIDLDGRFSGRSEWARLADEIAKRISFGLGRANNEQVEHPVIDEIAMSVVTPQRGYAKMAADQLGTVGSGNHYVDLLVDEAGYVWVGVHFGSRGFGHKTATGFLNVAHGKAWDDRPGGEDMHAPPTLLPLDQPSGQDYLAGMEQAGRYAYAGREVVVRKVLDILGNPDVTFSVHNHHNYAWREWHSPGVPYCVVRKGATPAWPGQYGFVGGSMGDISVVLRGRADAAAAQEAALYSTVHGAGRVMSRKKAAGKTRHTMKWKCQDYRRCTYEAAKGGYHKDKDGPTPKCPLCGHKLRLTHIEEQLAPGLVNFAEVKMALAARGIELRGAGADEAPQVYRSLADVLAEHQDTVEVVHTLKPRVVVMAGAEIYDPFKD